MTQKKTITYQWIAMMVTCWGFFFCFRCCLLVGILTIIRMCTPSIRSSCRSCKLLNSNRNKTAFYGSGRSIIKYRYGFSFSLAHVYRVPCIYIFIEYLRKIIDNCSWRVQIPVPAYLIKKKKTIDFCKIDTKSKFKLNAQRV